MMKKIFAAAFVFFLAGKSFGQIDEDSGFRLGLTISPQVSWLTAGDKTIGSDGSHVGFSYGLLADFLIPKNYAFATGIIISYTGGKLVYIDSTKFNSYSDTLTFPVGTRVDYRAQYVEIPLTMKLRTNQIGYMTYFGQFGLQGGIRFRSRADVESSILPGGKEEGLDFNDDVTLADLGLLLGAGLEYEITGNTALHASLQFYNGFLDVTDNPSGYKSKSTLNHLRLQLGVFF